MVDSVGVGVGDRYRVCLVLGVKMKDKKMNT